MKMEILQKFAPAMKGRSFTIYFWSQWASYIGTGLQMVTLGILVYEITGHSSFWVAMMVFLGLAPSTILCPTVGGVIIDKHHIRTVMYTTQTLGALQALALAYIATHNPQVWQIIICTVFGSLITSVDAPARHRLMIDIVPQNHIPSALALNGVLITAGQVIGGALAGIVFIVSKGYAGAFLINAMSFATVLATLSMMKINHEQHDHTESWLNMLKLGARYMLGEKTVLLQLALVGVLSSIGFSYRSLLPAIARDIYGAQSNLALTKVAGYVSAAIALGSVIGGLIVSANSEKFRETLRFLVIGGSLTMGVMWIAFPVFHKIAVGLPLMFVFGVSFTISFSSLRSSVKQFVKTTNSRMLGRIIGFDFMFFFGGMSIGNLIMGNLADWFGISMTMQSIGMLTVVMSILLFFGRGRLQTA
ncbi:MAG: MFS transporter [bacterium]